MKNDTVVFWKTQKLLNNRAINFIFLIICSIKSIFYYVRLHFSYKKDDMILDPFAGSSTTGIAANMLGRKFVGIEQDSGFLKMSKARRILLDEKCNEWAKKIPDLRVLG